MQVSTMHKNIIDDEYFWQQRVAAKIDKIDKTAQIQKALTKALEYYGSYRELYRVLDIGYIFIYHPEFLTFDTNNSNMISMRLQDDIQKIYDKDDLATFIYYLGFRGYTMYSMLKKGDYMMDSIIVALSINSYKIFEYIVFEYSRLKAMNHKFPHSFYQSINDFMNSLLERNLEDENIIKFLQLYYSIVDNDDDALVVIPYGNAIKELITEQINAPLFRFFAERDPNLIGKLYFAKSKELGYIRANMPKII
jgi:hypothetical protein